MKTYKKAFLFNIQGRQKAECVAIGDIVSILYTSPAAVHPLQYTGRVVDFINDFIKLDVSSQYNAATANVFMKSIICIDVVKSEVD